MKRFISGQCIRQISREEHRSRGTVSRIVNSAEVHGYVQEIRAAYYGLGMEALAAVRRALRESTDGKIAYQLLADIGVVPTQEDRQRLMAAPVANDDEEAAVQVMMGRLIQSAVYRASVYGTSLGEMGKDLEAAGARISYKTGTIEAINPKQLSTPTPISKQLRTLTTRRTKDAA